MSCAVAPEQLGGSEVLRVSKSCAPASLAGIRPAFQNNPFQHATKR
jgi:hypothetical protein